MNSTDLPVDQNSQNNKHNLRFGIITPTFKRWRLLSVFIRNLQKQTYKNWVSSIAHDGPCQRTCKVVEKYRKHDERIIFSFTEKHNKNWGDTPRLAAIEELERRNLRMDYFVLWDDDNKFYPYALETIRDHLEASDYPDVLLVRTRHMDRFLPNYAISIEEYKVADIDMANFVIKSDVLKRYWSTVVSIRNGRPGADFELLRQILISGNVRIRRALTEPIGVYDGLRLLSRVRYKLYPGSLGLYGKSWHKKIRKYIR